MAGYRLRENGKYWRPGQWHDDKLKMSGYELGAVAGTANAE